MSNQIEAIEIEETEETEDEIDAEAYAEALAVMNSTSFMARRKEA